jgi:hypothetical protein
MTINIHQGARDRYRHTALGVCTLLFGNMISASSCSSTTPTEDADQHRA